MALSGSFCHPHDRQVIVLGDPLTSSVCSAQALHGIGVSLLSSLTKPVHGYLMLFMRGKELAEISLRRSDAGVSFKNQFNIVPLNRDANQCCNIRQAHHRTAASIVSEAHDIAFGQAPLPSSLAALGDDGGCVQ